MTISRPTTRNARFVAAVIVAAGLALSACGSSKNTATTTATTAPVKAEVAVTDAWVRQSPAATTLGAAYLTLTSSVDDQLVAASVPTTVAAKTELHETVVATTDTTKMGSSTTMMRSGSTMMGGSGEMKMQPVSSIDLPAGQAVALKPGGYHIMMIDLVKPLTVGEEITITLTFAGAGTQEVTAAVRES